MTRDPKTQFQHCPQTAGGEEVAALCNNPTPLSAFGPSVLAPMKNPEHAPATLMHLNLSEISLVHVGPALNYVLS